MYRLYRLVIGGEVAYKDANIEASVNNCHVTCRNKATCYFFTYDCSTSMCLIYETPDIIYGLYITDLPKAELQLTYAIGYISGLFWFELHLN